jgi:hypothetical protein
MKYRPPIPEQHSLRSRVLEGEETRVVERVGLPLPEQQYLRSRIHEEETRVVSSPLPLN